MRNPFIEIGEIVGQHNDNGSKNYLPNNESSPFLAVNYDVNNESNFSDTEFFEPENFDAYFENDSFPPQQNLLPTSVQDSIQLNIKFQKDLGWDVYIYEINDILLQATGQSGKSLSAGSSFVTAVGVWQRNNGLGLYGSNGVIDEITWLKLKPLLAEFITQKTVIAWGESEDVIKQIVRVVRLNLPFSHSLSLSKFSAAQKIIYKSEYLKTAQLFVVRRKSLIASGFIPPLQKIRVPFGFYATKYKSLAGLGTFNSKVRFLKSERVDTVLNNLYLQGKISISQDDLDLCQRIADTETYGMIQLLNSYDSGVVSIGFMQFTLHVGKIQAWIKLNPAAFKRYGIELDEGNTYNFGQNGIHPGIKGVLQKDINQLRFGAWAERFYYAGLDSDIIIAEVELTKYYFQEHLRALKARLKNATKNDTIYNSFVTNFYNKDAYVRGLFQESFNNNPAKSTRAVKDTMSAFSKMPNVKDFTDKYIEVLKAKGWDHLVKNTKKGTSIVLNTPAEPKKEWQIFDQENYTYDENEFEEFLALKSDEDHEEYLGDNENEDFYENISFENALASPANLQLSPAANTYFLPAVSNRKIAQNKLQLQKSGINISVIVHELSSQIDLGFIASLLTDMNTRATGEKYVIDPNFATVDAVFTEAIHQFQLKHFINPSDSYRKLNRTISEEGILGKFTLDTLGIYSHGLKNRLNSSGFYGQQQLNDSGIKSRVPVLTNGEFTASNWYANIIYPAYLGVKITDGIHVLLYRKLKEAETWLMAQPQYRGLSPAKLGIALGFTTQTSYSGARLSANKQAMHGFGLALDIDVLGNPWVGEGWNVKKVYNEKTKNWDIVHPPESIRMMSILKQAANNSALYGNSILKYLHHLAQTDGNDTHVVYDTLKLRSNEFVAFLKSNSSELRYWRSSRTFGNRNPINGFLNLHTDLVYALRQIAGLAWGAIDFGPNASGDIMHFDLRTLGVGKFLSEKGGGFIPTSGHPSIQHESELEFNEINFIENQDVYEYHEAIEEALMESNEESINTFNEDEVEHFSQQDFNNFDIAREDEDSEDLFQLNDEQYFS